MNIEKPMSPEKMTKLILLQAELLNVTRERVAILEEQMEKLLATGILATTKQRSDG